MDLNEISKTMVDSALNFTRAGLNVAGSAIGYAAEVLKDFEHELKVAGERIQPPAPVESTPVSVESTPVPVDPMPAADSD